MFLLPQHFRTVERAHAMNTYSPQETRTEHRGTVATGLLKHLEPGLRLRSGRLTQSDQQGTARPSPAATF